MLRSLQADTGFRLSHPPAAVLQIQIRTDDMELAAELVQDIAAFLGVLEMDCLADFPAELEEFGRVLDKVCPLLLSAQLAKCVAGSKVSACSSNRICGTLRSAACRSFGVQLPLASKRHAMPSAKEQTPTLQVQEHNATRIKMTAEMADSSNIVKALIVKASPAVMSTAAGWSCLLHATILPSTAVQAGAASACSTLS